MVALVPITTISQMSSIILTELCLFYFTAQQVGHAHATTLHRGNSMCAGQTIVLWRCFSISVTNSYFSLSISTIFILQMHRHLANIAHSRFFSLLSVHFLISTRCCLSLYLTVFIRLSLSSLLLVPARSSGDCSLT